MEVAIGTIFPHAIADVTHRALSKSHPTAELDLNGMRHRTPRPNHNSCTGALGGHVHHRWAVFRLIQNSAWMNGINALGSRVRQREGFVRDAFWYGSGEDNRKVAGLGDGGWKPAFLFGWRWYRIRVGNRVADCLLVVINDKADDHGLLYGELDVVAALFEVLANIVRPGPAACDFVGIGARWEANGECVNAWGLELHPCRTPTRLPFSLAKRALKRPRESDHVCIGCAIQLGNGAYRDLRFAIDGKCKPLRRIPQLNGQIDDQRDLCPTIEKSPIPTEFGATPAGD